MKHLVVGPILLSIFRPWVVGLENVPKYGAVVLASNHLSFIDSIFLPLVVRRGRWSSSPRASTSPARG